MFEDSTEEVVEDIVEPEVEVDPGDLPDTPDETLIPEEDMTPEQALAVLMSAKTVRQTGKVRVKERQGMAAVVLKLRSLTDKEIDVLRDAAKKPLTPAEKKAGVEAETDDGLLDRLIIANSVIEPNLKNKDLLASQGVTRTEQLVDRLFLGGVQKLLVGRVMSLSGYDSDNVTDLATGE